MIYRILNVRQDKNRDFKLWYTDDYWDLFIWVDSARHISAFQLSFGKPGTEHLISWERGGTIKTARVESGGDNPMANRTPIMVPAGNIDSASVMERFLKDSKKIDPAIRLFIESRLKEI